MQVLVTVVQVYVYTQSTSSVWGQSRAVAYTLGGGEFKRCFTARPRCIWSASELLAHAYTVYYSVL